MPKPMYAKATLVHAKKEIINNPVIPNAFLREILLAKGQLLVFVKALYVFNQAILTYISHF